MNSSVVWSTQDPTLSVPSQDDFQQFLDMGINNLSDGLQFDFQDFNQPQGQDAPMMQQGEVEVMDTGLHNMRRVVQQDTTMQEQMPAMTSATSHPALHVGTLSHDHAANDSLSDLDAQIQYLQHQRFQQQQRQLQEQHRNYYAQNNRMIPPTPTSIEMHGNNTQFYTHGDPQHQPVFDRYRMQGKEQQEMAFTPLVSPAVTPLDTKFPIPEYTVPGAYFSPLSSPALHAQKEHSSMYDQRHSGTTNSPIDMNLDNHSAPNSASILTRKQGRKPNPKQARPATRGVRQSPIVKPKKSVKKVTSANIPPHTLGEILEPSHTNVPHSKDTNSSRSTASTEDSENGSISPEHLSDMAPPPLPVSGSTGRSPALLAQNVNSRVQARVLGSPATPASLMRLAQSPQVMQGAHSGPDMDVDEPGIDNFLLPEAANTNKPQLARLETMSDGQVTPTLNSTGVKTPGFQALPSPGFPPPQIGLSTSQSQSPQILAANGTHGMQGATRKPSTSARNSKKRSSTSILASPALLPRISPSIKPLLPRGGKVSEDTASLLLASKSNYQNILEGTHLPGVSYPMELSTNLTSKRTSHKIAEQGRRNRINSALQEIATLLPRGPAKDSGGEKSGSGDGGEGNEQLNGKGASQSANSKASTVEQAIDYIKILKKAVEDANKRADEAERQLKEKV